MQTINNWPKGRFVESFNLASWSWWFTKKPTLGGCFLNPRHVQLNQTCRIGNPWLGFGILDLDFCLFDAFRKKKWTPTKKISQIWWRGLLKMVMIESPWDQIESVKKSPNKQQQIQVDTSTWIIRPADQPLCLVGLFAGCQIGSTSLTHYGNSY